MTIGIVGNYGNDNQGDEAILEGMIVQFEQAYDLDRSEIIVFSNNPSQTREKFGVQSEALYRKEKNSPLSLFATIREKIATIRKLDILVIGGGGILMDLYRNGLVLFGVYGWMAKRTRTPFVIYGAGAGPINTWFGKRVLRSLVKGAELVTVRDENSKALLASIGVKKPIHVITDPAFYVPAPASTPETGTQIHIGVTAVPYYDPDYWPTEDKRKNQNYIEGMARNLDQLLASDSRLRIHFISTKYPHDAAVTKEIQALMHRKQQCSLYDENMDQEALLKMIQKQDFLIGTRLHSLILALVVRKPIIGVSYHRKVSDFMHDIGCKDTLIPIETLHQDDNHFLNIYQEMINHEEQTNSRFQTICQQMINRQPQGMDLVKNAFPDLDCIT